MRKMLTILNAIVKASRQGENNRTENGLAASEGVSLEKPIAA